MEPKPKDLNDFLESLVLLEEAQYQEGFRDGCNDGLVSGKEEGRDVGLKMGFQVGEELGFYRGCVDILNSVIQIGPSAFSSRVRKNIEQLGALVNSYPLLEPENERVQEIMENMRLKFRVVSANLGVRLDYEGYRSSSGKEVEDL